MKKLMFGVLFVFMAAVLLVGPANVRAQVGRQTVGFLVPYGYYNDTVDLTIGVQLGDVTFSGTTDVGTIYVYFFDKDGVRLAFKTIPVDVAGNVRQYGISLRNTDDNAHPDVPGYVIVLYNYNDSGEIGPSDAFALVSGYAVLLDVANDDAAYIPAISLGGGSPPFGDFNFGESGDTNIDLNNFSTSDISNLMYSSMGFGSLSAAEGPFLLDLDSTTTVIIWTVKDADPQFDGSVQPLNGGEPTSFTLARKGTKLNVFNIPADATGFPSLGAGLIKVNQTTSTPGIMFTLVKSGLFKATQTLMPTRVAP